jgi:nicotinamidase-related amidase
MPEKNENLHGNVPDESPVALVLIDVINDLEFENGAALLKHALPAARKLSALKARAQRARIPVIFVNDNFGKWRSDFRHLLGHVLEDGVRGQPIAELLRPGKDDYFVLKAKHSGFYHTQLDLLIEYLKVKTLIFAGLTTDICVLFTAADAYMRDLHIVVPPDCVAAARVEDHEYALEHMKNVLDVQLIESEKIDFKKLAKNSARDHNPEGNVSGGSG